MTRDEQIKKLKEDWASNPRWAGIVRPYSAEDVVNLRNSIQIEYTLARLGAEKLWNKLQKQTVVSGLGALTGNQAIEEADAGLDSVYLSGWQVAGDANVTGEMYPDQSLYAVNSVPAAVEKINNALIRADQIQNVNRDGNTDYFLPIVADAEAGFGGNLNAYELMKAMIKAGAAGVHFEDQLSSAKKCGHLGGKVLVPTREAINKLVAARLAADVMGVPTLLIARTDAEAANLITSDIDPTDAEFIRQDMERTSEGFYHLRYGIESGIARAISYAPYSDLIWMETKNPDLHEAQQFAMAVRAKFPNKMLAYNCSPSFNWAKNLSEKQMLTFREDLASMGYKYQFVTLAGFHSLNLGMFEVALAYRKRGMAGYSEMQQREFARQSDGFRAVKHQNFVGVSYFDAIQNTVMNGESCTTALHGSTEEEQFN